MIHVSFKWGTWLVNYMLISIKPFSWLWFLFRQIFPLHTAMILLPYPYSGMSVLQQKSGEQVI